MKKTFLINSFLTFLFFSISYAMENENCSKQLKKLVDLQDCKQASEYPNYILEPETLVFIKSFLQHPSVDPLSKETEFLLLIDDIKQKYMKIDQSLYEQTPPFNFAPYVTDLEIAYKKTGRMLIQYLGVYSARGKVSHNGLAQILPMEIACLIATYLFNG